MAIMMGLLPPSYATSPRSAASDPRDQEFELHLDPHQVVGVQACTQCHAAEVQVWKQTPHAQTFDLLHRQPEARQIAARLGIQEFRRDSACTQCHYTMRTEADGSLVAIAGVSCESCHGAAKQWLPIHHDYGDPTISREEESDVHRQQRLQKSIAAGMRNPVNAYLLASSCYRCHTVPDERLVNVGQHRPGSLDFELVSWSQGTLRHNFLHGNGMSNPVSSPERRRLLFVAGFIADLEFSLRATAKATEATTFAIVSAHRANRAARRLRAIAAATQNQQIEQVVALFDQADLSLGNSQGLVEAADAIHELGVRFAAETDPLTLQSLDPYVPEPSTWK